MSRKQCIYNVYIADGFADDCDELIHRCMQVNTLSYEKFCDVWKDMKFASIFHGRASSAELAELSEEVLHIAKHYMVANTSNFEESIAGLFLVYALLNLQPMKNFAALRLIDEDVPAILRIQEVARRARRYDVLYILGTVLIKGPTQYHVAARERGLEHSLRKYLDGQTTIDKQGVRPKGVFFRQNEELDILRELNRLGKLYKESKLDIGGKNKPDRSLTYVNDNLTTELETSLKKIITGIIDDDSGEGEIQSCETNLQSGHNTALSIKERAMRTTVKPIRHLTGIQERSTETLSSDENSDQNESLKEPAKVKSKSPKQYISKSKRIRRPLVKNIAPSVTTHMPSLTPKSSPEKNANSPKKITSKKKLQSKRKGQNIGNSPKRKWRRKRKASYISSDEDDISLPISDDVSTISDEVNSNEAEEQGTQHELDIQIDSLPVFIRSEEEGLYYEIEIIDNYDKNGTTSPKVGRAMVEPVTGTNSDIQNNLKIFDDVSIFGAENPSTSVSENTQTTDMVEISTDNDEVKEDAGKEASNNSLKLRHLKKREKRDLKKINVKTKFQRMGLLTLANFQEKDSNSKK